MTQQEIEVILARQLAEYLEMSIFIVGPSGDLLYYNEPAQDILGSRYAETGSMPAREWSTIFKPVDREGNALAPEELPLMIALTNQHPAHRSFWIKGLDGTMREIEVTAFPILAQAQRFLGAIAIFWEVPK